MENDDALLALMYGPCDAQAGDSTRRLQTGSTGSTLIHKPETQPNRNGRSSKAFSIVENEMLGARPEFLRNLQLNDTDSPSSSPLSPDTTSLKLKSPKKQSIGTPKSRGITKKPKKSPPIVIYVQDQLGEHKLHDVQLQTVVNPYVKNALKSMSGTSHLSSNLNTCVLIASPVVQLLQDVICIKV
eukprot:CAMPEP_0182445368 /NCGR_PEP_ID=MMETSP1172-20130603/3516_1 /TAXON_ID=708627 /ORGANISM="Timspurckia oligopyrenoides, Strain CCMP3278" /LENGTH=184 /DNA_ID=CAMNT_0024641129 /DNA_START=100 /DNA_END=655 /DNA_ORIENTATION=+